MFYNGHHLWGMHLIWWFLWFILIFWVFALPYEVPGQRKRRDSPLDVLKKRFAAGEISKEEFEENKKVLENEK